MRKVKCYMEAKLRIRIGRNVFFLCAIMIFFFFNLHLVSERKSVPQSRQRQHRKSAFQTHRNPARFLKILRDSVTRKDIGFFPSALFMASECRFTGGFLNGAGSCLNAGCAGPPPPHPVSTLQPPTSPCHLHC